MHILVQFFFLFVQYKDMVLTYLEGSKYKSCDFPGFRLISCGRENIRLWRVRNGTLRSCLVNLAEYHSLDFTDVTFEEGSSSDKYYDDRTL